MRCTSPKYWSESCAGFSAPISQRKFSTFPLPAPFILNYDTFSLFEYVLFIQKNNLKHYLCDKNRSGVWNLCKWLCFDHTGAVSILKLKQMSISVNVQLSLTWSHMTHTYKNKYTDFRFYYVYLKPQSKYMANVIIVCKYVYIVLWVLYNFTITDTLIYYALKPQWHLFMDCAGRYISLYWFYLFTV